MGDMLAGRYRSFNGSRQKAGQLSKRLVSLRERFSGNQQKGGSRWASMHGWAGGGAMIQDVVSLDRLGKETQAPSRVAEQLIIRQQAEPPPADRDGRSSPPPLRKGLSRSHSRRNRVFNRPSLSTSTRNSYESPPKTSRHRDVSSPTPLDMTRQDTFCFGTHLQTVRDGLLGGQVAAVSQRSSDIEASGRHSPAVDPPLRTKSNSLTASLTTGGDGQLPAIPDPLEGIKSAAAPFLDGIDGLMRSWAGDTKAQQAVVQLQSAARANIQRQRSRGPTPEGPTPECDRRPEQDTGRGVGRESSRESNRERSLPPSNVRWSGAGEDHIHRPRAATAPGPTSSPPLSRDRDGEDGFATARNLSPH